MLGSFTDGGSTVLGLLSPHALAPRLGAETVSTLKLCVVQMRRALAEASGVPERRLRLSGAFLARLAPPPPKRRPRRRAALSASRPKPYWNVHVDAFNVESYEHTSLLYLGDDFDGGSFAFSDPDPAAPGGRALSPLSPSRGLAVFFSSGWENMHQVAPVLSGTRFAVPAFFVTKAADADATADDDDAATADALWRSLLRPESEADFKQIFARWHALLARGCEV